MHKLSFNKSGKGFTLVELLIVIIIIAVLAAIAIPKFSNSSTRSKESALRSNLKILRNALELCRADVGGFPSVLPALTLDAPGATTFKDGAGTAVTITAADWRGPYVQEIPTDIDGDTSWTYSFTGATTGKVNSNATGGTPAYNTW